MLKWLQEHRRRKYLAGIRETMSDAGLDVSVMSDEEVEAAWLDACKRLAEAGRQINVAAAAVGESFQRLGLALNAFHSALSSAVASRK